MQYHFGHFYLDADERRLLRDGQTVPLTPKAFDTLLVLVQHAGHAVSKDDLMRAVWPDGFVEESNLAFNISTLRKTLGEGQNGEHYIETVPKLGYRFVMPVRILEDAPVQSNVSQKKRSNLPSQLTRFIGRTHELVEVTALVEKKRLVTLVGAGGVGKTRLALEAGAQLLKTFTDGVWLAEFAPLADESLVPATVASLFGLQAQNDRSLLNMIVASIGEKRMLLILDNCEHVIDASAKLAEALLQACPNLHILATSREALRVNGEAIWRVPSLEVPDAGRIWSIEQVTEYDAVQLFVEHATLVQPDFALTKNNQEIVLSICRRLDGIPLAIEMASAQLDSLDLKSIAAGLETSFNGVAHGSRTAVPRHQTLRATLDWSYNLLSEPERALLARLSVFRGGFTADAALAVCVAKKKTLQQLIRKSMVMVTTSDSDEPRYRLLETIREYATALFFETIPLEENCDLKRRYIWFFVQQAERIWPEKQTEQNAWLNQLDDERANICSAIDIALDLDEVELAQRLAGGMGEFWRMRSHWREARIQLQKVLAHSDPTARTSFRAKVLIFAGIVEWMHDGDSHTLLEEALSIANELGDRDNKIDALVRLGNEAWRRRHFDAERAYYLEALSLCQEKNDVNQTANLIELLADSYLESGQLDLALNFFEQVTRIRAELENVSDLAHAWVLRGLGQIALLRGDYELACTYFANGLRLIIETKFLWVIAVFFSRFAALELAKGNLSRSAILFSFEDYLHVSEGALPSPTGDSSEDRERIELLNKLGRADFEAAYAAGQRMSLDEAVAYALNG